MAPLLTRELPSFSRALLLHAREHQAVFTALVEQIMRQLGIRLSSPADPRSLAPLFHAGHPVPDYDWLLPPRPPHHLWQARE